VFADANGILTIPGSSIQEVLVKVEEVSRKESDVKEELSRGRNILNVLKLENRYKHPTESLAQQIL
jgi:regulator of RNase E activity RraA